uniref:NB-ARC domain-containing protein n=1 Tax=Candidatus Kentrum sp. TC TaxID=2126339 RepID=A0A450ZDN3_9GAMM|nr:MAG: NB-ARC domain-containing protein [Candidatus Kentron sp. TC]
MAIDIPHELKQSIKDKKLIIFTGAGISMKEGLPSWKDLVLKVLSEKGEYIKQASAYASALEAEIMSPLEVLDKIESDKKYIFDVFESHLSGKDDQSEFIRDLSNLTSRFITTNFDSLIEGNIPGLRKITKDSCHNLKKIDAEDSYVIKMHGDIHTVDHCVIFSRQYKSLYSNDSLAAFQIKKLFSEYTVLFMGFSFSDPHVRELFDYISRMQEGLGPKHYIITTEKLNHDFLEDIVIQNYSELDDYIGLLAKTPVQQKNPDISLKFGAKSSNIISEDGSDIPPSITEWVGRGKEVAALAGPFKVCFITGIGGQGKSVLAAYYLEKMKQSSDYKIFDWRDFKEEDHKFQNKIISLIMLAKAEHDTEQEYVGLNDEMLVNIFFRSLRSIPAIFVLDNVDRYIDLEEFVPLHGIGLLYRQAIDRNHGSKFIFTCRPFVKLADPDFFQLPLGGLDEKDVVSYFKISGVNIKNEDIPRYASKAFELTQGHPLWISLIVAQGRRGKKELDDFINSISRGDVSNENQSSIMSENILGKIWSSLSVKHRIILRSLAESVQSLTVENYSEIVSSELNYNQFTKALRAVKNLGLTVWKEGGEYVELHPLVKEFIKTKYPRSERTKFIHLFTSYYGRVMLILKPRLSSKLGFDDFRNWTNKIELHANATEYQEALLAMYEIHNPMKAAGYIEEYLRVANIVFKGITWTRSKISSLNMFEQVYLYTTESALEYGDKALSDYLINKLDPIFEKNDPLYVTVSRAKIANYWFNSEYSEAINIYEKTAFLLESAKQPENASLKHIYALALRDSGEVEKALDIFLSGEDLDLVANDTDIDNSLGGEFYGNIGRCLQFLGRLDESLNCVCKSFICIYDSDDSNRLINIGYASKWLFEVLKEDNSSDVACHFYRLALDKWEISSPPLRNQLKNTKLCDSNHKSIMEIEDWRIKKYCNEWVRKRIKVDEKNIQ